MDKEDGRKLSRQAQHERRKQAVRLHQRGMSFQDIAQTLGIAQNTARSAVRAASAGGVKAFAHTTNIDAVPKKPLPSEVTCLVQAKLMLPVQLILELDEHLK